MNSTQKTIVFWVAVALTAVLLNAVVRILPLKAVDRPPLRTGKKVEYSIAPVEPSADALRAVLESKGNQGWELAAPVVTNGTTTALIFKREKEMFEQGLNSARPPAWIVGLIILATAVIVAIPFARVVRLV